MTKIYRHYMWGTAHICLVLLWLYESPIMYNDVNNQQDAATFSFINLFKSALHVSGDKFAHPQEHFLTVAYIQLLVQCTDPAANRCHG